MSNEQVNINTSGSVCAGCEMDNSILHKLFDVTIRAAQIIKDTESTDTGYLSQVDTELFKSVLNKIAKPKIHSNGTICEWNEEYEETEPGHRHFSHLWGLCPGDSISLQDTPELALAARKSLENRLAADGGHTGWSRAWLVNFFARLGDGENANKNLEALFNDFTLPNLFNDGPPFQIDGNFGALSGMTQMLMQSKVSNDDNGIKSTVNLLPALPKNWASGNIRGLLAKGNIEVDIEWKDRKLVNYNLINLNKHSITVIILINGIKEKEITIGGSL